MRKNKDELTFLFTGGHFTTALAVYEKLKEYGYKNFLWAGHKYSMLKDKETSFEYKAVTTLGIPFYTIHAGKLYRYISLLGVISFLKIPIGFVQSFFLLLRKKPDIVISFGGYLALPIACSAWILGIPVISHEQTVTSGLANSILAHIAQKVLVSWKTSLEYLPKEKAIFTGNPIRSEVFIHEKPYHDFGNDKPVLLILGGNQGSHRINELIKTLLPQLVQTYNIIHQCGSNTIYMDYTQLRPLMEQYASYIVTQGIWGDDIGRAYNQATIILSRSGANTIYEIAALEKYAIFIPLPFAYNNEQLKNAKMIAQTGNAQVLEEKDINEQIVLKAIDEALGKACSRSNEQKKQESTLITYTAAENIVKEIENLLK